MSEPGTMMWMQDSFALCIRCCCASRLPIKYCHDFLHGLHSVVVTGSARFAFHRFFLSSTAHFHHPSRGKVRHHGWPRPGIRRLDPSTDVKPCHSSKRPLRDLAWMGLLVRRKPVFNAVVDPAMEPPKYRIDVRRIEIAEII